MQRNYSEYKGNEGNKEMKIIKDICYCDIAHPRQKLDIYLPDSEEFDVFIYLHGGGMESGSKDQKDKIDFVPLLIKNNFAVVMANYRLYPSARYPEFICDGAAALAWVYKNIHSYGKVGKIYAGGCSAGGYISQMLCFDEKYLKPHNLKPTDFAGFIHDAGQPTTHFNVLRERGIDVRKAIVDESAPLYHIGESEEYPPMLFVVSDNDMPCRYEQTQLVLKTMSHFEYDMNKVRFKLMHGTHCQYNHEFDENGDCAISKVYLEFFEEF